MRITVLPLLLAVLVLASTTEAKRQYPVISGKRYTTPKGAATGGGAYAITRNIAGRGLLGAFGTFNRRQIVTTQKQGNRFDVRTRKLNPDNGQPLATTSVDVVRTRGGKFHFVQPGGVNLNLPILTTQNSRSAAARAAGAKAMLKNAEVQRWFAHDGLKGADVVKKLRASVERTSGNTAHMRVYTRSNGQDGFPMVETTIKVRKLRDGQWRGYDHSAGGLRINDLWE